MNFNGNTRFVSADEQRTLGGLSRDASGIED